MARQSAAGLAPLALSLILILASINSIRNLTTIISLPKPIVAVALAGLVVTLISVPRVMRLLHSAEACFSLYTSSIAPVGRLHAELASITAAIRSLSKSKDVHEVYIEYPVEDREHMKLCIKYNERKISKQLLEKIIFNYTRYIVHFEAAPNTLTSCTMTTVHNISKLTSIINSKKQKLVIIDMKSYLRNTPQARQHIYIDVGSEILISSKVATARKALSQQLHKTDLDGTEIIIVKPYDMPTTLLRDLLHQHRRKCTIINVR